MGSIFDDLRKSQPRKEGLLENQIRGELAADVVNSTMFKMGEQEVTSFPNAEICRCKCVYLSLLKLRD